MLRQICQALSYLHAHKIVHRDIKLENVLLSNSEIATAKAKLADFGLSQHLSEAENRGSAQAMVGTRGYLAPEVAKGQLYTTKADLWSLGCLLFAMITVKLPFGSKQVVYLDNVEEKKRQGWLVVAYGSTLDLTKVDASQTCKDLLRLLLQVDPEERPSI